VGLRSWARPFNLFGIKRLWNLSIRTGPTVGVVVKVLLVYGVKGRLLRGGYYNLG